MEMNDSGGVILVSYHSYSRICLVEEHFASCLSPGHTTLNTKAHYQGVGYMASREALRPPPSRRSVLLHPPEYMNCNSMEDYWSELKSIDEDGHCSYEPLVEHSSIDEAELAVAWLHGAGLSTLVSGTPEDGPTEALLSTLTRSQAALVRKQVNHYTQTMRKKNKQPLRHVRDVFPGEETLPGYASNAVYPISPEALCPPKLPLWVPMGGGENCMPDSHPRRETLLSEVPYSDAAAAHRVERFCQDCRRVRKVEGDLPTFQASRPTLGLTRVQDLSSEDMKKIGYISLIELTTFYDCLGIELKRNQMVRLKARETGIFGVPLTTLLENDQKKFPGSNVPLVFRKLLSILEQTGLQTEGILRVPGSASRVKHLRRELESRLYQGTFDWEQVRQNDAAGLLKMFIRELPYTLLTLQHLPAFSAVQNISSPKHQIQALQLLIMLLPEAHRDTLKALLDFLRKVVAHEEKNRMSLWNVAMIVAPNLFISQGKGGNMEEMQGATGAAQVVCLLITHQDLLWTVPCFLVTQLRKMNAASTNKKTQITEKTRRKLLRRWIPDREKGDKSGHVKDLREGVIRVHAPLHEKVSMAIQLDSETKARDVVARFDSEKSKSSRRSSRRQKLYLFEVGGNIGERCLDPETHLQALYHVNPACEWVLKPKAI